MIMLGEAAKFSAPEQLIEPDPPQLGSHEDCVVGVALSGIVRRAG